MRHKDILKGNKFDFLKLNIYSGFFALMILRLKHPHIFLPVSTKSKECELVHVDSFVPRFMQKRKTLKLICPSVCSSHCLSVTLSWLISSDVLKIYHWYSACMILVTRPFNCIDLDLWPSSRSKLLTGVGPQFSKFACWGFKGASVI